MRGYFVALMLNAVGSMAPRPRLYGEIHFLNTASLRAHLGLGYRVIRTVSVTSILGFRFYRTIDDAGRRRLERRFAWRVQHL
jgi:hypothetical protein